MKFIPTLAMIIIILGALNWGMIGLGEFMGGQNWNVIAHIFDQWPEVLFTAYIVIGVSGAWALFDWWAKTGGKKRK